MAHHEVQRAVATIDSPSRSCLLPATIRVPALLQSAMCPQLEPDSASPKSQTKGGGRHFVCFGTRLSPPLSPQPHDLSDWRDVHLRQQQELSSVSFVMSLSSLSMRVVFFALLTFVPSRFIQRHRFYRESLSWHRCVQATVPCCLSRYLCRYLSPGVTHADAHADCRVLHADLGDWVPPVKDIRSTVSYQSPVTASGTFASIVACGYETLDQCL